MIIILPVSLSLYLSNIATLLQQIGELCLSSDYSDVTFIIGQNKLPAHKCILAARSPYFRAMLYSVDDESIRSTTTEGAYREKMHLDSNNIELKVSLDAFKHTLKFFYTGYVSLNKLEQSIILDLLRLAHDFSIEDLESGISAYLIKNLTLQNSCAVLDAACAYDLTRLQDATLLFMDRHATEVLNSSNFKILTPKSLTSLLIRDTFYIPEIEIFKAVLEWRNHEESDSEFQVILLKSIC